MAEAQVIEMEEERPSYVPVLIAVVLSLPIVYSLAYFALVLPGGKWSGVKTEHYRLGSGYAEHAFWPLEQLDRRLRPRQWDDSP